jgi:hypothetical protein
MKKYNYVYIALIALFFTCDDSTDPNDFFDENANGAWLRTVSVNANFNLNDISTADYSVTLEENDIQNGALLSQVNAFVSFIDNTIEDGDLSVTETSLVTFNASEFDTSSGKPVITHAVTAIEITDFLNLDPTALAATDVFIFRYELILTDGRVYSVNNAGTNITSTTEPFYNSPFQYNVPLVCPISETYATGSYQLTTTIPGLFGESFNEMVTLTIGSSPTKRTFPAVWLPSAGFGNTATYSFELVCGQVFFDDQQFTGLGCTGSLVLGASDDNTIYDENDDTVILINFAENIESDCGGTPTQNQMTLTKQ